MRQSDLSWLLTLTHLPSISGHEDRVVSFVREWTGRRDDLRVKADRSGNLWITQVRRSRKAPLYVTAHMDHPGFLVTSVEGRDAVLAMYSATTRRYEDGTPRTRHVTSNAIVEIAEDERTGAARSCFTVLQQAPDSPLQPIVSGRYEDTFQHIDGRWWFDTRVIRIDLVGDLGRHLLIELP